MTGHIRTRAGAFELRYDLGPDPLTGKRRVITATVHGTRKEAEAELRRRLRQVDVNEHAIDPEKQSTEEWIRRWLRIIRAEIRPITHDGYSRQAIGHIIPYLGAIPLAKLAPTHVQEFHARLAEAGELSGSTRRLVHSVLSASLSRAVELGIIGRNPCDSLRRRLPRRDTREMQVLTTDQARKVIEESAGSSYGLAILLGLATGCRRGELCALKWRNVDLDKGLIRIIESTTQVRAELFTGPTKNSRPRSITLPAMAIEALRRARIQQAQTQLMMGIRIGPESFVCCWPDGSRLRPIAFSNYARRLFDRLGLPVHLHSLRHTHATALLLAGVHPKTAQDRLGHSKIGLTMDLYSHVTDALRDEAAEKIDAVLRG